MGGVEAPISALPSDPDWVLTLLQSEKMRLHDARGELVKCIKRLPSTLQTIKMWAQEVKTTGLHEHVLAVQEGLRLSEKPFIQIDVVESWAEQYQQQKHRYRFLVLEGPSQFGKTRFAQSLSSSPGCFLEVDCTGATEPHLKDFRELQHDTILFDECTPQLVLNSKTCSKQDRAG